MAAPVALTGAGNVTTQSNLSASSDAVSKPANVTDGDLLVFAFFHRNAAATITPPSGVTAITPTGVTSGTWGMFAKPIPSAAAEAATSYTFSTSGGAGRLLLICTRVTGADPATWLDAQGAATAGAGSSVVMGAVTAVASTPLLLAIAFTNTSTAPVSAITAASGMTEVSQVNADSGTATSNLQLAQQQLAAAGSTGTRTATASPGPGSIGGVMATIDPAPVPSAWIYNYSTTQG